VSGKLACFSIAVSTSISLMCSCRAEPTVAAIEVAKSTAQMIEQAGAAARPDRVDVEFGLKFSASGTVIMAGVAGEASLKVTLGYDVTARPAGVQFAGAVTAQASQGLPPGPLVGSP
jgi:hypothetical protein